MQKINVALIGFGLSGRYLQAPFFEQHPDFNLQTVMTSQQDLQVVYPQVSRVRSLEAVLTDETIDLVSICSPNETHFDYARQCLLAGKHVLVEKPFTATADEAEELIALAKQQDRQLFAFQNRRFDSDFLTIQKLLADGRLGDLLRYDANFNRFKPLLNPKKWKEQPAESNGILYDLGAHLIDQCIALFGAPQAVQGESYTQRAGSDIDDAFDIWLDYGPMKAYLHASLLVREPTPRYVLHGMEASFVKYGIDPQEDQLKAGRLPGMPGFGEESAEFSGTLYSETGEASKQEKIATQPGNWPALFENIADVLLRGAEPLIQMEEIVQQLRVIGQVRRIIGGGKSPARRRIVIAN
ncbi:MAG: Gfo/Idh/MocA family oxidoreductase [Saprospiraceae bacterium]